MKHASQQTVHFATDCSWANSQPNATNHCVLPSAAGPPIRTAPCSRLGIAADMTNLSRVS